MIIFNINAIITGFFIAIVCGLMYLLLPDYFVNSDLGTIVFVGTATLISGFTELAGVAGRLFFLPMWLIGVVATLVLTFMEYGWWGILGIAGILVGLVVLILILLYFTERSDWTNAPRALMELQKLSDTQDKHYWEELKKAFFFPSMVSYTHEICEHNLSVIKLVEQQGLYLEGLEKLQEEMLNGAERGSEIDINSETTDVVTQYIDQQLEAFEENS